MGDWGQRTEGSRQRTEGRKLLTVGFRYRLTERRYLAGVDRSGRGFNPRPAPELLLVSAIV